MADINFADLLELIDDLEIIRDELQEAYDEEKDSRWQNRRWFQHPYNEGRLDGESFLDTNFQELKNYPEKFKKFVRMEPATFDYLLRLVGDEIGPKRKREEAVSAEHRLAITLCYLAHGSQIALLSLAHRIAPSTLYKIIPETCEGIFRALSTTYLKAPETVTWRNISKGFEQRWQLPGCLLAIDGKHFRINAPDNSGSMFFNYKKSFSVVMMAGVNHNLEFVWVSVGSFGSESDGGIFSRSVFGIDLENGRLNIPGESIRLPNSNVAIPYYFIGDDAFRLRRDFMKPYKGNDLTEGERIFNYRLSRARRCVESAFGILVMRWRIFERAIGLQYEQVNKMIRAAVCLHNFLSSMNDVDEKIEEYKEQQKNNFNNEEVQEEELEFDDQQEGHDVRRLLTEYFNSPQGEVPWQYQHVRRGQAGVPQ